MSASVSVSDCLCLFNLNLNSSLRRVALRGECLNTKEEVYPESDEHTHMHLNTDEKREFGNRSNTQTPVDLHTQIYVHTFSPCKVCFILSTFKTQMLPHSFQDMLSFRCDSLSVCTSLAVFGTLVFFFLITQYFLMPDTHDHLYKYLSVMTLWKGQKDEDRGSEKRGSLSVCIVTRKQRQTKVLGHSSQTACPQCLLVTMAYGERCQDIIM